MAKLNKRVVNPPDTMTAMKRAVRKAEKGSGSGGTGYTVLKLRETTVSRLIANRRIGGSEMRAIEEIERVYRHLCCGLFTRSMNYGERLDKGAKPNDPDWFIDAYHKRYIPWADRLSDRKKANGDITLQVVCDVLFSGASGKDIDRENRWRNGSTIDLFIAGVRAYAAYAGWADRGATSKWIEASRCAFQLLRMPTLSSRVFRSGP